MLTQLRGGVLIALDDEEGKLDLAQRLAHHAADPPMADQDDVIGKPSDRDRLAAARLRRRSRFEVRIRSGTPNR
ncbi:MAG: hypothetical protein WBE50_17185, partial [Methyloceanibacter sp.]